MTNIRTSISRGLLVLKVVVPRQLQGNLALKGPTYRGSCNKSQMYGGRRGILSFNLALIQFPNHENSAAFNDFKFTLRASEVL
jgi:hypothetical protein